ncbi:hypothetical protein T484DRAFT_1753539 [Baffinella frigidus]|nr:hypothetical protein T484DRAFT_1753539 [Cryptophyta sp. CCMP2293]
MALRRGRGCVRRCQPSLLFTFRRPAPGSSAVAGVAGRTLFFAKRSSIETASWLVRTSTVSGSAGAAVHLPPFGSFFPAGLGMNDARLHILAHLKALASSSNEPGAPRHKYHGWCCQRLGDARRC